MAASDVAIAQMTKSAGFADRVKKFVAMGKGLIAQNEEDVFIADEARVIAELIIRGKLARRHEFYSRKTVTTGTADLQFFDAKSTAPTLDDTNMTGEAQFTRDQVVFVKGLKAVLDPAMTQADKRIVMNDHIVEFKMQGKEILPTAKIRQLPAGGGIDGELNNGVPHIDNAYQLPFFLRIPPNQNFDIVLKRLTTVVGGATWLELGLDCIVGFTK